MTLQNRLNFSGGPGVLPESVLHKAREAMLEVPGVGLSILGISHRSDWFLEMVNEIELHIASLLDLPDDFRILLLQGGATQQFSMIPMTLLRGSAHPADYLHTGYWSGKAIPEAQLEGPVRVVWSGQSDSFARLPNDDELAFSPDAPYLHYASNETVEGIQFHRILGLEGVPRVCDMSSDFLSRPIEVDKFDILYAHAQKNLGPAGVTVVIIRDQILDRTPSRLPKFLDYRVQSEFQSAYNTPPVSAMYIVLLVLEWMKDEIGGLHHMAAINHKKADYLYQLIDNSDGFFQGIAAKNDRSLMNATFRLPSVELEKQFLLAAQASGFSGLNGHRAVGGIRASIYNAMTVEAVEELVDFMECFQKHHQRQRTWSSAA